MKIVLLCFRYVFCYFLFVRSFVRVFVRSFVCSFGFQLIKIERSEI